MLSLVKAINESNMQPNKFGFVEISDEIAANIDGGMTCVDIKAAIDRWKSLYPGATHHDRWQLTTIPNGTIEIAPLAKGSVMPQLNLVAADAGQATAMALGSETAVGTNVYFTGEGQIVRTASSFSMS